MLHIDEIDTSKVNQSKLYFFLSFSTGFFSDTLFLGSFQASTKGSSYICQLFLPACFHLYSMSRK